MECEKFIKDYAEYRIKMLEEIVKDTDKGISIKCIQKACALREKGYVTVDEAIKIILNPICEKEV